MTGSAKLVGWVERSETHHGNCDMRWVSQGLNLSYELRAGLRRCFAPLRKRFAFVAGNDEAGDIGAVTANDAANGRTAFFISLAFFGALIFSDRFSSRGFGCCLAAGRPAGREQVMQ
jgi:hypothetical protein